MRSNSERDEILHYLALGREEDAKNILRKKSSVNVTDFSGNTAGHLARSVDVLRLLAKQGAEYSKTNNQGKTPLDLAVLKNDIPKLKFLLQECHCQVSVKSVATILGLIDGNRELPYVFRDSFKSIAFEVPSRNAVMEVKALRHKLDNEIRGSERKIEKLNEEHRLKIGNLSAESQQKLEHAAKTHKF